MIRELRPILPATAFVAFLAAPQLAAAQNASAESCLSEAWPQRQISCLRDVAVDAADPKVCLRSEDPAVRWQCVALYAEQSGDASRCGILPQDDLDKPGVASDLCRTHLAIAWHDPDQCNSMTTPRLADSCLLELVQLGEDKQLCARIETEVLADACRGL